LIVANLFLWLFGDNVEARLGRVALIVLYLAAAWLSDLGSVAGVTAVMGSYFMLLPQSRVLMLVPVPSLLVEVPAVFFLGIWAVLHVLRFVGQPHDMAMFALAFFVGALVARLARRRVEW
jgi:membrane associated rhomboid family serine protease